MVIRSIRDEPTASLGSPQALRKRCEPRLVEKSFRGTDVALPETQRVRVIDTCGVMLGIAIGGQRLMLRRLNREVRCELPRTRLHGCDHSSGRTDNLGRTASVDTERRARSQLISVAAISVDGLLSCRANVDRAL